MAIGLLDAGLRITPDVCACLDFRGFEPASHSLQSFVGSLRTKLSGALRGSMHQLPDSQDNRDQCAKLRDWRVRERFR
jgi:hypothetical protein